MNQGPFLNQLNNFIGKKIRISILNKIKLEGKLCGYDQFLNLSIDELKIVSDKKTENLGLTLVRGSLIVSIRILEN